MHISVHSVPLNNCMHFTPLRINPAERLSSMLSSPKSVGSEPLKFVILHRSVFIPIVNVLMMALLSESDLSFS